MDWSSRQSGPKSRPAAGHVTTAGAAAVTQTASEMSAEATKHPARIGIFDDDALSRTLLTHMVALLGYTAFEPRDPDEAIDVALGHRIDVLLLDLNLADHDGIAIVRRLRSLEQAAASKRFPVIAVTGYVSAADRAACLAAGFDRHLGKPVKFADLRAAISDLLNVDGPIDGTGGAASDADRVSATARRLREAGGNERVLAPTQLEHFVMRSAQWIEQMNRALNDDDLGEVAVAARAICDSAETMGATRLASLSASLERIARDGDEVAATAATSLVNAEHAAILALLLAHPNE